MTAYDQTVGAAIIAEGELKSTYGKLSFYKEQEYKIHMNSSTTTAGGSVTDIIAPLVALNTRGTNQLITTHSHAPPSDEPKDEDCCIICREELFTHTLSDPCANDASATDTTRGSPNSLSPWRRSSDEVVMLTCAHLFHSSCIKKWLENHFTCVICKVRAKTSDLTVVPFKGLNPAGSSSALDLGEGDLVEVEEDAPIIKESYSEKVTKIVQALDTSLYTITPTSAVVYPLLAHHTNTTSSSSSSSSTAVTKGLTRAQFSVPVETHYGQYGTKIDAVITDIMSFLASPEYETQKAIVFSQWPEVSIYVCKLI